MSPDRNTNKFECRARFLPARYQKGAAAAATTTLLQLQLQLQQRQARKFQQPEPREISELRPSIWMKEASKFDFPASLLLSAAPDTPTSDAARQFGAARGNFLFFSLPGNSIWLATRTEAPSS